MSTNSKRKGKRPQSGVAGLHGSQRGNNTPPSPLKEYAETKKLPVDFLEGLGLSTVYVRSKPVVKVPYYDIDDNEVAARFLALTDGKSLSQWRRDSKPCPYGLWKLDEAKRTGNVVLVEGESNSQTLWHYGIPALGIPGDTPWRKDWARYVRGLKVYVWQGDAERVGSAMPDALVLIPPQGRKDISECHVLGDDVVTLLRAQQANAAPYRVIRAAALSKAAAKAKRQAVPLLTCPDILGKFGELCKAAGLVEEGRNAKILYLAATSRLLDKPICVVVKGPSAGGKSYAVTTVLRAFPDSAFYALSSMSERALIYDDEPLQHRMLIIYEAAGFASDFGAYIMRSLLSEGHLKYITVEKTQDGLKSRLIEREGPTGLITTTTWAKLDYQQETRLLSITVLDDREQTRGIMHSLALARQTDMPKPDFKTWHAFQTWLELAGNHKVVIPYATQIAEKSSPAAVRLRRDFAAVLDLIEAHAILYQEQRKHKDGRIVADLEDYRAVYDLVSDLIDEGARATVRQTVRDTVKAVKILSGTGTDVTNAQVGRYLGLDKSAAYRRVRVALSEGYIVNEETKKGRPAKLVLGDPLPAEKSVLPHPDELVGGGGGYSIPLETHATMQPSPTGASGTTGTTDTPLGEDGADGVMVGPVKIGDLVTWLEGTAYQTPRRVIGFDGLGKVLLEGLADGVDIKSLKLVKKGSK